MCIMTEYHIRSDNMSAEIRLLIAALVCDFQKTLGLLTGLRLVPVVGPINIQIVMNVKFT